MAKLYWLSCNGMNEVWMKISILFKRYPCAVENECEVETLGTD